MVILSGKNIEKHYNVDGSSLVVLDNVAFELHSHDLVFLCGINGSGKSTLLNIISYNIELDSVPSFHFNNGKEWRDEYKKALVYLPQKIDYALADNLRISEYLSLFSKDRIEEMLDTININWLRNWDKSKRLIKEISFGQKQLLLALALLSYPSGQIYLFDEVFASIDVKNRELFIQLLKHKVQKTHAAALLVSHDYEFSYNNADRIYILSHAQLKEFIPKEHTYLDFINALNS